MAKIDELLLTRMKAIRPESKEEKRLNVIIETKDQNDLNNIIDRLKAHNATDIRPYKFSTSVAAKIPVSEIQFYERMQGVEKLWDGIGKIAIPPQPKVGIRQELMESIPLIMEHPDYHVPDRFPDTSEVINGYGVKICIIDSGIDKYHPDLQEQVAYIMDFTTDRDGIDYTGHGTHVAGIIAGSGKASNGNMIGVAPGSSLYIAKVFSGNDGLAELTSILDAIEWAVENKMDIVNMSLGSELPGCDGTCHLCRAADWAAENGVTVVLSAGNSGSRKGTITCPANSRYPVTVGAIDKSYKIADFSSRGPTLDGRPKPDIVTPGAFIRAARAANTSMGSPIDEYYTIASGTSMAAPHCTGVAALLIQTYRHYSKREFGHELQLDPKDIKNIVMQGTIEIDTDANIAGNGLVNVPLCVKTMEDTGRIPSGLVVRKNEGDFSEKTIGIGEIKIALDILNILIFIYKNYFHKDDEKKDPSDDIIVADASLEPSIQKTIELAASVAAFHLAELGIPLDCNIHFLNDKNEVVLSLADAAPRERINSQGFMGLYKPASQSAYIRLMSLPEMISTIAHENAHHFLTKQSALGKFMKDLDAIYEIHKEGSDIAVDTIIGNVRQDYGTLFRVSKITHEGFASWVGHYVLQKFVDTLKKQTFEDRGIDGRKLDLLFEAYDHLSKNLDRRASEYYYGRLEYCNIEDFFGSAVVPYAALYCMNISYNPRDFAAIHEITATLINQDTETLCRNLEALKVSPDLRLVAISRILPQIVQSLDDISKMDDPQYFVNAIRRSLGEGFLETNIKIENLKLKEERQEDTLSKTGVIIGYVLAEIAYGNARDVNGYVGELLGMTDWKPIIELGKYVQYSDKAVVKIKAKEILDNSRVSDRNIKVGEAISRLDKSKSKDQILEVLNVLKEYNSDAAQIYTWVLNDQFKSSWDEWLKALQKEMSVR